MQNTFSRRWFGCAGLGLALLAAPALAATELAATVSWVGNSYGGGKQWVLQDVEDLFVDADGSLFTNVEWDEAGGNVQEYRDGDLKRVAFHTHGWGYEGGQAVTANSRYVFIAQKVGNEGGGLKGDSWPPKGLHWAGVSRRLRSDLSKPAPFEGGHGKEGDVLKGAFLVLNETGPGRSPGIRGLAATESLLYVSSPADDSIKTVDVQTMNVTASWKFERPDKICFDRAGRLWVLQRPVEGGSWRVLCLDQAGQPQGPGLGFPAGVAPAALCVDAFNRLLVADAGADQQIKIYSGLPNQPVLAGALGVKGGIFAGPVPGRFGALRFNRPRGVGVDARGRVYVASSGSVAGGSTVLECYSPEGSLVWRRMGLTFVDLAALDPGAETDAYTKEERFTLDYTRPAGREWAYHSYTVNPWKYPDDPRVHLAPTHVWVRRLAGQRFLFASDMTGDYLHVYRFQPATDGETAIPCALLAKRHPKKAGAYPPHQPEKGEWIWLDRNGDGAIAADEFQSNGGQDSSGPFVPDSAGSLWQINGRQIRCLEFQGAAPAGTPLWDYTRARTFQKPPELDEARRLLYLPGEDTLLLGGNKGLDKNQHWKPMGPVLCCYDNWRGAAPALRWNILLPYEKTARGHESAEPISFDVAGDFVFVAYTRGLKEEGTRFAFVKVLSLKTGAVVGNLVAEKALGEIGLLDIVESVSAARRSNGEYVVFLEDDYKSKVVMFRWKPAVGP